MCIFINCFSDGSYTHSKRYIYKESGCKVSRTARIGDGCVLGRGCVIEGLARLERTIVGRECVIGSGAVVIESHLWAGEGCDVCFHFTRHPLFPYFHWTLPEALIPYLSSSINYFPWHTHHLRFVLYSL